MIKNLFEFEEKSKPHVRIARPEDISRLVEVDLECFRDVYEANPVEPEDIYVMLATRQSIAQELMVVGEIDGVIEGFMTCQRTDKNSDEITSWDETTNFGTIAGTHVPEGKNFYIVNLTVTEKGSKDDLSDQLIAKMVGRFLEVRGEIGQLLSRMPQFSQWLSEQGIDFATLSEARQDELAAEYIGVTKVVDNKERLYDGMLQRYGEFGARPVAVLRDGFDDPASQNYSVLCEFKNPLPDILKKNRIASLLAGRALGAAANHPRILKRLP